MFTEAEDANATAAPSKAISATGKVPPLHSQSLSDPMESPDQNFGAECLAPADTSLTRSVVCNHSDDLPRNLDLPIRRIPGIVSVH
jgi:hypothetical protein